MELGSTPCFSSVAIRCATCLASARGSRKRPSAHSAPRSTLPSPQGLMSASLLMSLSSGGRSRTSISLPRSTVPCTNTFPCPGTNG